MTWPVGLALVVVCLSIPSVLAGTPDDPEVVDAAGDVAAEGVPVAAGAEWADVVALWFTAEPDSVWMHLAVAAAAPPGGFYGEVAAFLRIDGAYMHAGWTTVLPPFATEPYHGGFVCPSDATGAVDPATCDSVTGAVNEGALFSVPLASGAFGWAPGSEFHVLEAYSDVWYLDVQVQLDATAEGRAFVVPGNASASAPPGVAPAPAASSAPTGAGAGDAAPAAPGAGSVRESGSASVVFVLPVLAWAVVRFRAGRGSW